MLWIATLAALSAAEPEAEPLAPTRQAQATVRILRAATVQLGEGAAGADEEPTVQNTTVRDSNNELQPAVLVEFY